MTACRACAPFGMCACGRSALDDLINARALVEFMDAPRPIEPQDDDGELFIPLQRSAS